MLDNRLLIEKTLDGSNTLFVPALNEHYHSTNGAIQEAEHIFIQAGLLQALKHEVCVLEIGFGTGLNTLLTALKSKEKGIVVHYCTIEAFPIAHEIVVQLNFTKCSDDSALFNKLHEAIWNHEVEISPNFYLTKIKADLTVYHFNFQSYFDVIYFDAFSPNTQAEMWTQEIFDQMYMLCKKGAYLITYCAKGEVRRRMQRAGFEVERLAGPPGKREMLRAKKC